MRFKMLEVTDDREIATVTLNRPEVRNAFNETLILELTAAFEALDARADIRAIVLAANGSAFCAGADLNWMEKMAGFSADENRADALRLARMLAVIDRCSVPVIARVQGDAYAGGVGLIAVCDIAVVADHAKFCLSEARLGLIPATIAPYVVRAFGARHARRYFVTAEIFDCMQAVRMGFVHEAVPLTALDPVLNRLTDALRAGGPLAVRACKRLVAEVAGRPVDDALLEQTAEWIARTRAGAEAREGVAAFLEKRAPAWRG